MKKELKSIKKTGNEAPIKGIWEDSNGNTLAMEQQKQDVNRDPKNYIC